MSVFATSGTRALHLVVLALAFAAIGCSNTTTPVATDPFADISIDKNKDLPDIKPDVVDVDTGGDADDMDTTGEDVDLDAAIPDGTEDTPVEDTTNPGTDTSATDTKVDIDTGPVCTTNKVCANIPDTKTPFCAVAIQKCVECLVGLNCPTTNNCQNYKCVPVTCKPGAVACKGDFLETCNSDGKSFTVESCPDDKPVCSGTKCLACQPNKFFCAKPEGASAKSTKLLKCNEAGSGTMVVDMCDEGEECVAGKCQVCVPGSKICMGDNAMECAPDGSQYQVSQNCSANGWTCLGGLCLDPCASDIKSNTNVGCDYWAVDLDNAYVPCSSATGFCDAQNAQFSVIISNTTTAPALVTVTAGNGMTASYQVPAGGLKILNLPDPVWKTDATKTGNQDGSSINKRVYRIQSDKPIVAYQFNPLQNYDVFSNDASLLLPSNGIGNEYWVMTREQTHAELRSYFTVVGTSIGETIVTVLSSAVTAAGGGDVPALKPGMTQQFTLTQGQVLNVETNINGADPTGTWIQADKPIAVFGGSEASNSPNTDHCINGVCEYQGWACQTNDDCPKTCCADHLEEQLFPISSWGTMYVATKLQPRGAEKDAYRVLAAEDGTLIDTDPKQVDIPQLSKGQWFEFESTQDFVMTSNKPIQVAQYMASANAPNPNNDTCDGKFGGQKVCKAFMTTGVPWSCVKNADCPNIQEANDAKTGDPAMIMNLATDQYMNEYIFLVPDKYKSNYVNIVAPTGAPMLLNGAPIAAGDFKAIAAGWSGARIAVQQGVNKLTAEAPVGLLVYGYADFVSYGYPGGAALK
jgi:hypothetical protein